MELEQIALNSWLIGFVGVLGGAISLLLLLLNVWRIRQNEKAEKKLLNMLKRECETSECPIYKSLGTRNRCIKNLKYQINNKDYYLGANDIKLYRDFIQTSSKNLNFNDRARIMEGINQPSKQGQIEYIKKIVNELCTKAVRYR